MDGRNESEEMDSLFRAIDFLAGKAGLERRLQARIWERGKEVLPWQRSTTMTRKASPYI